MLIRILFGIVFLAITLKLSQCHAYKESIKRQSTGSVRARRFANDKPQIKYRFTGADGQYVKFRNWVANTNGPLKTGEETSLSFEFRTKQADSFLLYLDDGGTRDFIAATLVGGVICVRFKFGLPASATIRLGTQLNDNNWHNVTLRRRKYSMTLVVDQQSTTRAVRASVNGDFIPRSMTYFGGLPNDYKLQSLSLPSIFFKSKFIGQIRRIRMNKKVASRTEKFLVREDSSNRPCSDERNPCRNNGKCYVQDGNIGCECSLTSFTGKYCHKIYEEAVATFRGTEWLSFDLTQKSLSSYDDEISLSFKTRQPNGLLLHTGKSADFVTLSLKNGFVLLVVNLGSGAYQIDVQPIESDTFNDGKWHSIRINRTLREVNIVVDQANIHNHYVQDDYTQLTLDDVIYVGGSPSTESLPGTTVKNNFIGCLKEVSYSNTDGRFLPISRLAKKRNPEVSVHGNIQFTCQEDINGPISFLSPESFLNIQLQRNPRTGSIDFRFRTTEENGVLVFSLSNQGDLFAIELYNGVLYIVFNLGSGASSFSIDTGAPYSDGKWHKISVSRVDRNVTASVDGIISFFWIAGSSTALDTAGQIYMGGTKFASDFSFILDLKNAPFRKGFVGCLNNLKIDYVSIDMQSLASSSGSQLKLSTKDIVPYCKSLESSQCYSDPCRNGGVCKEQMYRFECDCSMTSFSGQTCDEAVVMSSFNGNQMMNLPLDSSGQTDAEEISLRFKTLISTGLLFGTSSNTSRDALILQLVRGGKLQLYLNIGQGPDVFINGENLNDGNWHNVKVSRRGHRVSLSVDGRQIIETISGQHYILGFDVIHLGMYTPQVRRSSGLSRPEPEPFAGYLENLVFNKISVIDSCATKALYCNYNSTLRNSDYITAYSVTFPDENSYVALPTLQAYSSMSLSLSFKTTIKEGLILFNGGNSSDYVAIELVEGRLYYVYNLGNGEKVLSILGRRPVNDNEWHDLKVTRSKNNLNVMTLDGRRASLQGSTRNINLDLTDNLYIGGASQTMFRGRHLPDGIVSRVGFQGCLANIDLNGKLVDLMRYSGSQPTGVVLKNCKAPKRTCRSDSCRNGGKCIQLWNDFVCDCSLTAYVGARCGKHGTAYGFLPNPGVMLYQWTNYYPSPREDNFALAFSSAVRNALLFKVTGNLYNGARDYLELALVKEKLTLQFNIGSTNVTLVEPRPVADGQYHKCVVRRKWMNATMRVDNWPVRLTSPDSRAARSRFERVQRSIPDSARPTINEWLKRKERTNTVFSSQSMIQIGGLISRKAIADFKSKRNLYPVIKRPFKGQMAGFFFNDVRVFELAVADDPRVTLIGDVQQIGNMLPTAPSFPAPTTTMTTETTFSTAKTLIKSPMNDSGCDVTEMCNKPPGFSGEGSAFSENNDDTESDDGSSDLEMQRSLVQNEASGFQEDAQDITYSEKTGIVKQKNNGSGGDKIYSHLSNEDSKYYDEESERAFKRNLVKQSETQQSKESTFESDIDHEDDAFSGFFIDEFFIEKKAVKNRKSHKKIMQNITIFSTKAIVFSQSDTTESSFVTAPDKVVSFTEIHKLPSTLFSLSKAEITLSTNSRIQSRRNGGEVYSDLNRKKISSSSPTPHDASPSLSRILLTKHFYPSQTVFVSDNVTRQANDKSSASIVNPQKNSNKSPGNLTTQTPMGTIPNKNTLIGSVSLLVIIGAAGSCLCILLIILLVMCCRKREHIYNVKKETQKHEQAENNGKHLVVNSNGTVIKEKTTNLPKHDNNKEVLV